MSALRAVLLASLVAVGMVVPLMAAPTVAFGGEPVQSAATSVATQANESSNATVGEQISGFMQQQTSQADGAVESGMWTAAYENASEESARSELVNRRTDGLSDQLATLQAERQELIDARKNGKISNLAFRSRMSGLAGQYASLLAAINETEPRAEQVGANVSAIRNLRNATVEVAGPELAAAANDGVVSPPGLTNNSTVGPPDDVPAFDETNGTNGNVANPGNGNVDNGTLGDGNVGNPGNGNGQVGNDPSGPPINVTFGAQVENAVNQIALAPE